MSVLLYIEAFTITTTTASLTSWFLLYFGSRVRRQAPISRMLLLQQLLLLSVLQHPVSCRLVKPGSVAKVRVSIGNAKPMAVKLWTVETKKTKNINSCRTFSNFLCLLHRCFSCVSQFLCSQFDVLEQLTLRYIGISACQVHTVRFYPDFSLADRF